LHLNFLICSANTEQIVSISKNMKFTYLFNIALRLFVGGMLVKGGIAKFSKPMPDPTQMIEKVKAGGEIAASTSELKIRNYIFGMKQTGYFWQVLGVAEILGGLLLLSQFLGLLGAVVSLPTLLQIFLFHLFLEPDEVGELIETGLMLAAALWLIGFEHKTWLPLLRTNWWALKTSGT
jgi:uncharacterized membrane protein YphA (DoxX/SURF4 family)